MPDGSIATGAGDSGGRTTIRFTLGANIAALNSRRERRCDRTERDRSTETDIVANSHAIARGMSRGLMITASTTRMDVVTIHPTMSSTARRVTTSCAR